MAAPGYNAYLAYTPVNAPQLVYRMYIMEYSQPHALSGTAEQSKMFKHWYPKSYSSGNVTIIGRTRTQTDYNNLAIFIRNYHIALMNQPGMANVGTTQLSLMKLYINGEGINLEGIPTSFQAGATRFNVAPQFQFDFLVIKDAHSANTDMHPGFALRRMWTGDFIDEGSISFVSNSDTFNADPTGINSNSSVDVLQPGPTTAAGKPLP